MRLDDRTILDLCRLRDPVGILSIYVASTPDRQTHAQPEWTVAIRNALRDLRHRVKEDGPRERWVALHERLDALQPELDVLLDPKQPGRGRALFARVSDDELHHVALQMPLPDEVVFQDTAYVRPLVAALDEGRPAAIAFVDRTGLRLLEWRLGEVRQLNEYVFDDQSSEWREMTGPAAANPARAQQTSTQRDTFEERLDDHRLKFLRTHAHALGNEAASHGWDRIVVAGDGKFGQAIAEAIPGANGVELIRWEHDLRRASPHEVAESIRPILDGAQRRREIALVERTKELALSGGHGAVGIADTLSALGEGRVRHLVYDDARAFEGFRASDGTLLPPGDRRARSPEELQPEPNMTERMVERALSTGAQVTPVEGPAAEALGEHDGVAAILRW